MMDYYPMIMLLLRDGEVSRLSKGCCVILADDATGTVTRLVEGVDELGRQLLNAEGETVSRFVKLRNENLVGWNYLVRWDIDGVEAGEQHAPAPAPSASTSGPVRAGDAQAPRAGFLDRGPTGRRRSRGSTRGCSPAPAVRSPCVLCARP